ncbi:uncharacterized protein [Diadema antillarum]|uniref:uncharacterized protein isoform X2 n=1 Tax=Diadema antillarum TaxID=105358 RepID=UPI003A8BD624
MLLNTTTSYPDLSEAGKEDGLAWHEILGIVVSFLAIVSFIGGGSIYCCCKEQLCDWCQRVFGFQKTDDQSPEMNGVHVESGNTAQTGTSQLPEAQGTQPLMNGNNGASNSPGTESECSGDDDCGIFPRGADDQSLQMNEVHTDTRNTMQTGTSQLPEAQNTQPFINRDNGASNSPGTESESAGDVEDLEISLRAECQYRNDSEMETSEAIGATLRADSSVHPPSDARQPLHPNLVLTDKQLMDLAKGLGEHWETLGLSLGFNKATIYQCKANNVLSVVQQTFDMLNKWKCKSGRAATTSALLKACKKIDLLSEDVYAFLYDL